MALDGEGSAPTLVLNTIIAGNLSSDVDLLPGTSLNSFNSAGHNLIGNGNAVAAFNWPGDLINTSPLLSSLDNYGGPTPTMPPQTGSLAIDGAMAVPGITTDQRGFPRPSGPFADIGAVEFQVSVIVATNPPVLTGLTVLGNGTFQFGFTNLTGASFTVFASTSVALPFNLWSNLGPAAETPAASGQFQFTNPDATNHTKRYYRVRSP